MSYPYSKIVREFTDIRPVPSENGLYIHAKDFRGKPVKLNVLDFNGTDLYNLINEVYNLGKSDQAKEVKRALKL